MSRVEIWICSLLAVQTIVILALAWHVLGIGKHCLLLGEFIDDLYRMHDRTSNCELPGYAFNVIRWRGRRRAGIIRLCQTEK